MFLFMILRKLAWKMGLTGETKSEHSDVLHDSGKVTYRNREKLHYLAMEHFYIEFTGNTTRFFFDDENFFNALNLDDRVSIAFREVYLLTYDYDEKDLETQKLQSRKLHHHQFVGVEKLV